MHQQRQRCSRDDAEDRITDVAAFYGFLLHPLDHAREERFVPISHVSSFESLT